MRSSKKAVTQTPSFIATKLAERISSGEYPLRSRLPSERELSQNLGVHRRVVRSAITSLVADGWLDHKPNCRPVVVDAQIAHIDRQEWTLDSYGMPSSRLIAMIQWRAMPRQKLTSYQRIFWGLNNVLGQNHYHPIFLDLADKYGDSKVNVNREATHLRYALSHGFGGTLLYPYGGEQNHALLCEVARKMPVVLIDRKVPGLDLDIVSVDNRTAMYNATKHLIDLGHRNIVHAVYNESPSAVQDRLSGYYSAMWDAFGNDAYGIVLISPGTPESPWPLLDAMLSLPVELRPTAIACVNDYLAYTVAERLLARQMSIPQDISVTGFDDILSMLPNGVGLTTMAQPFEEIGQKAAELLLSRLQSPILPCRDIVLPAAITIRGSTAPPPT